MMLSAPAMNEYQPDPSGPQWTSGWEYQAGAALARERAQEGGPVTSPQVRLPRRKAKVTRWLRWFRAIALGALAVVALGVALADIAKGHDPGNPLAVMSVAAVASLWIFWRLYRTRQRDS